MYKQKYLKYKKKYLKLKYKGGELIDSKKLREYLETDNIPIPIRRYPINKDKLDELEKILKEKIDKKDPDCSTKDLEDFYDYKNALNNISFVDLIKGLYDSVEKFEKDIGDNKYTLGLLNPYLEELKNKSNYWISQIIYNMLSKKPNEIINEYNATHENILICDDGSYSGNQIFKDTLHAQILKWHEKVPKNIYIIIPFLAKTESLLNLKDNFLKTILKNLKDRKQKDINIKYYTNFDIPIPKNMENITGTYLDHKMPDNMSTYDFVKNGKINKCITNINNLVKNCDTYIDSGLCPYPPYKNVKIINNEFEKNNIIKQGYRKILTVAQFKEVVKQILDNKITNENYDTEISKIEEIKST